MLSDDEIHRLRTFLRTRSLGAPDADRASIQVDEMLITALLLSGLRNSEFCALTLGDTIVGTGKSAFVVRRDSGQSRTVYVPRCVSTLVCQYVKDVRPRFLRPGVAPGDPAHPLLLNEHRRPYERTGLYRRVVRILSEAGFGGRASVRLLRHTYGYLAYSRTGGNLLFVQRQMGHAHPRITSVYAKLVDECYADLAERIVTSEPQPAVLERGAYAKRRPEFDCETD